MFNISEELKKLPARPGVYIMKDSENTVIYVGKAKNLHNRVRHYFQKTVPDVKTAQLAKKITHFEYVVTDTENEAFILENNLIKLHRPKYNIRLKDGKSYPYIKITAERLPRVLISHKRGKDKAKYYGPFVTGSHVHDLLELMHRLWPLRRCAKLFPRDFDKGRPCLNNHIGQCKAPCNRLLPEEIYDEYVREAERFIRGKTSDVAERLSREMHEAAEKMEFERAAELRDTINALKMLKERQKTETGEDDRDYIATAQKNNEALMQVFFVRGGKLVGREHFLTEGIASDEMHSDEVSSNEAHSDETHSTPSPEALSDNVHSPNESDIAGDSIESNSSDTAESNSSGVDTASAVSAFIKQFYGEAAFIPKEIVVAEAADKASISAWLSERAGRQVAIVVPKIGEKLKMLKLAQTNAELTMSQFGAHIKRETERNAAALAEISEALGAQKLTRIEAYDISNIQGYESVGSMVVFENGKAKPTDYRKFRLRTVVGPDDYAAMEEVLSRRLARLRQAHEARQAGDDSREHMSDATHSHEARQAGDDSREHVSDATHSHEARQAGGDSREHVSDATHSHEAGSVARDDARRSTRPDSFCILPDIIFADGGKGQISAVEKALREHNINIPVCGMVKDERHRTRGLLVRARQAGNDSREHMHAATHSLEAGSDLHSRGHTQATAHSLEADSAFREIILPRHSEGFKLLTRIQDEVHRFALEYHKKLRAESQTRSVLDEIPGIGKTRRKELLRHFKSIDAIRAASIDELSAAPSMNKKSAEAVHNFFNKER
ncbi:MAG: excinuclease ABC subunit UvrC [Defluviitaleaceae bacterium]|nr:excinuclease ABC subunit UvrC [Defluviitaleaceae bacterium]